MEAIATLAKPSKSNVGCADCRNGIKAAPWETLHTSGALYETLMYGVAAQVIELCSCDAGQKLRKYLRQTYAKERDSEYGKLRTDQNQTAFESRMSVILDNLATAPPALYRPEMDGNHGK